MKSTKSYVGQFRLDQENYEFSREDFLLALNEDFLELLQNDQKIAEEPNKVYTYSRFRQIVSCMQDKFWAISNKKIGEPFTKNLWSAFYAIYVVPQRDKLFPRENITQ